jgi:redox-sensitive bicupin YhaK (pirin superfamily)
MMDPRYRDVKSSQIPGVSLKDGVKVKILCGKVNGVLGPVRDIVTDPEYLDITVPAATTFTHPIKPGQNAFAYVIEGEGYFDPNRDPYAHEVIGANYFDFKRSCLCGNETIVLYGDGEEVAVTAEKDGVRFLLVSGKPIGEPVAWYGPIVMNTQEELKIAFEEYQNGTFIKFKKA